MRAHLQKAKGSGGPHGIGPNWRPAWLRSRSFTCTRRRAVHRHSAAARTLRGRARRALRPRFPRGRPEGRRLFYHPACLVDLFMTSRITGKAKAFGAVGAAPPRRAAHCPADQGARLRTAAHCQRASCRRSRRNPANGGRWFEANTRHDAATAALPTLWAQFPGGIPRIDGVRVIRRPFWRFCEEAVRKIDRRRSANFPTAPRAQRPARTRRRRAAAAEPSRAEHLGALHRQLARAPRSAIAALNNTPGSRLVLLDGKRRRLHDASLTDLMRDANYTLCPTGDTPESERSTRRSRPARSRCSTTGSVSETAFRRPLSPAGRTSRRQSASSPVAATRTTSESARLPARRGARSRAEVGRAAGA